MGPPKGRLGRQRQGRWDEGGPYGSEMLTLDLRNQLGGVQDGRDIA